MKNSIILSLLITTSHFVFGQVINVEFSGAAGSETLHPGTPTTPLANVTNFPVGSLTVNVTSCPVTPSFNLNNNGATINPAAVPTNVGGTWTAFYSPGNFTGLHNTDNVNIIVTCGAASTTYNNIFSSVLPAIAAGGGGDISVFGVLNDPTIIDPIILEARSHLTNTYDRKNNKVYIVLGPEGEVLSKRPVNIDEDDEFIIFLIAPDINKYNITSNGVYNPSDLSQTNPPNPTGFGAQSFTPISWKARKFDFGPYTTTENGVTFQITKRGGTPAIITPSQSLTFPINKFYHVDYAVSVVTTNLASPTYRVAPLNNSATDKTIIAIDEGKRTMITFNVIWYWKSTINKLFKKSYKNDPITRGRDRIKEPYFWDRINPSFGLSIDQGFRENYFVGGVFEFARGGNICVGGHYGKFNALADKKFQPGETLFNGTNEDIITTKEWDWGFYFGITLDTRIFNRITSSLGRQ